MGTTTTPMIAPDGSSGEVPNERVPDAIRAGGKVGMNMIAPDGSHGTIPLDRTLEAIKAGARPVAPINTTMQQTDVLGRQVPSPLSASERGTVGDYESSNLKPIGEILGGMAPGGLLASPAGASTAVKALYLAGRSALSGAGVGAGAFAGGASPKETERAAATGAILQPVSEGISAAADNLAPKMAESALRITDRMRGRGRTIGDAVLAETHGISPATLTPEIRKAIGTITQQMETSVDAATKSGAVGSAQPAQQALNDAIANLPRNARNVSAKLSSLHDLLDLGGGPKASYTPTELLEMKRGIGKEISTWPAEWQKLGDVQAVKERMYGALDSELDRIVPGNAEKNQIISSLIPAKQQAQKISNGASIAQLMAHRMAAHTGALAASGIGGAVGYQKGGTPGAVAGATAGLVLPELASSTAGQMLAARLLSSLGDKAASPELLPLIKALAASTVTQGK